MHQASRAKVMRVMMDKLNEKTQGQAGGNPIFKIVYKALAAYSSMQKFMGKLRLIQDSRSLKNELTLEGLRKKKLELLYFDFYDLEEMQAWKTRFRGLISALIATALFYVMCSYFINMSLKLRLLLCCAVGTLLILTLSFSLSTRCIFFLALPSMAQGNVKSVILVSTLLLVGAGPLYNWRRNTGELIAMQSCIAGEFWQVTQIVQNLLTPHTRAAVRMRMYQVAVHTVIEILYRKIFIIRMKLEELVEIVRKKFEFFDKLLKKLRGLISMKAMCFRLFFSLSQRYRDTKLLGGGLQALAALANSFLSSNDEPDVFAKPTVGYFINKIGNGLVCPLLRKAKQLYHDIRKIIRKQLDWIKDRFAIIIGAVRLLMDMTQPDSGLIIRSTASFGQQLTLIRRQIMKQILNKTESLREGQDFAARIVQYISLSTSLIMLLYTVLATMLFFKKFMKKDDFENVYITAPFLRLEEIEQPLLPLDPLEKIKYTVLSGGEALSGTAMKQLKARTVIMAVVRIAPVVLIIIAEYTSFNIVGFFQTSLTGIIAVQRSEEPMVFCVGSVETGMKLLAQLFIKFQEALQAIDLNINILACAPYASPPNPVLNLMIFIMACVYIIIVMFKPVFLLMRHMIITNMCHERAVYRAVWLRRQMTAWRQLSTLDRSKELKQEAADRSFNPLQQIYTDYIENCFSEYVEMFRGLFNLPSIRCAACGIRGNTSMKSFYELFVMCDTCKKHLCVRCAHGVDEVGTVVLMRDCRVCGGVLSVYEFDEEEMEETDPLNELLNSKLGLRPDFRVGPRAMEHQAREAAEYIQQQQLAEQRSIVAAYETPQPPPE